MQTFRSRVARAGAAAALFVTGGAAWAVVGDGTAHAVPPDTPGVGPAGQGGAVQITIQGTSGPLPGDTGTTFAATYMNWAVRVPVPDGGGAGRPQFGEFVFRHDVGQGSPALFAAATRGTRLPEVRIELVNNGPSGRSTFYRYTLQDARIVRLQDFSPDSHGTTGSVRIPPQEEVAIAYTDMRVDAGS